MELFIPSYLKEIVKRHWDKIDNLSLKIEKFSPFVKDRDGTKKPRIDKFNSKIKLLKVDQYEMFFELQRDLWESVGKMFTMRTKSRLIIGLGNESIYETSIRLHRNYGVPYIPGSALKGVAKHYTILNLAERLMDYSEDFFKLAKRAQEALENPAKDESNDVEVKKAIEDKLKLDLSDDLLNEMIVLRRIFGTQRYEGEVIFFDAFPTPESLKLNHVLELDIMNPHYQPYYTASEKELRGKSEKAPGDWHQPTPVFFLTVPRGIRFQFAIAPRNNKDAKLLDKTKSILISALKELGIGAKTSLGYGRFE